jgi:hypothetical protein
MRAQVRELFSLEIDDLATWTPPDPECFALPIRVMAGPQDDEGSESFDLTLCTPAWLQASLSTDGILNGRHHLIVKQYDFARVTAFIRGYVESCTGATWAEVGEKVGRLGYWEFEDYQS